MKIKSDPRHGLSRPSKLKVKDLYMSWVIENRQKAQRSAQEALIELNRLKDRNSELGRAFSLMYENHSAVFKVWAAAMVREDIRRKIAQEMANLL